MPSLVVAYRHGRWLLAVGAMLLILFASVRAVLGGAAVSDVAGPVAVILILFAFFGFRYVRRTRALQQEADFARLAHAVAERRAARQPRPIVGAACPRCERRIVVEADGRHCSHCGKPVHRVCEAAHTADAHTASAYR
jgi:putative Ca2+/H+ antiporter (TMEM165/GDT1 family)